MMMMIHSSCCCSFAPPRHPSLPSLSPAPALPPRSSSSSAPTASSRKPKSKSGTIHTSTSSFSSSPSPSPSKRVDEEAAEPQRFHRVQMETSGAYRLIDRHTGNQVIVWGDAHDPSDAPIPSHLLLSSATTGNSSGSSNVSDAMPPVTVAASGFARLKAQKVKSLMMRKYSLQSQTQARSKRVKKPILGSNKTPNYDDDDVEEEDGRKSNSSSDGDTALFSTGAAAGAGKAERGIERARGGAASSLRGWGGVSPPDYSYSYFDRQKLPRKSLANDRGGFFSKTSFKNLGCSHPMITALTSIAFLRPSHIQVPSAPFKSSSIPLSLILSFIHYGYGG
jgi:ATP-dependent RNA helicase DDX18/HAS1